jgi:DNA-binding FadR family transcriptional regulator
VIKFDGQFHCAIAFATGNMLYVRLLEDLQETLKEQTLAVSTLRNRGLGAAHEHHTILTAIRDRDGDAAAAAMEEHLDAVERAIRRLPSDLSRQGDTSGDREATGRSPSPRRHHSRRPAR